MNHLTTRLIFLIVVSSFIHLPTYAQYESIDSLLLTLKDKKPIAEEVDVYNELAWLYRDVDTDSSVIYATLALNLAQTQGYVKAEGDSYSRLGIAYRNLGKYPEAIDYFNKSLSIRTKLNDFKAIAQTYISIGEVYRRKGQLSKALLHFFNSTSTLTLVDDYSPILADAYNRIGQTFQQQNDNLSASEYYEKSLIIHQSLDNQIGIANNYLDLSSLSKQLGLLEKAKTQASNSLQLYKILKDKIGEAKANNNLGNIAIEEKDYELAKGYYKKAFVIFKRIDYPEEIGSSLLNTGVVEELEGNYYQANEMYQEGLKIFTDIKDSSNIAQSYHHLANLNHRQKKWSTAQNFYDKALAMVQLIEEKELLSTLYFNLSTFYGDQNQHKKAQEYSHLYIKLSEGASEKENIVVSELTDVENAFNILSYQSELQEKAIKEKKLINQILIGLTIFIILCLILLGSIFFQRYKIRQAHLKIDHLLNEQEINILGHILEGEEQERQRIAADLHDRVGSLLSTIQIFFNDLFVKDENIKVKEVNELLDNTVEEVRRISHNLASGILEQLGLTHSVQELTTTINKSDQITVTFIPFGMNQRFPLQMEIKIYRIIQELTSNALKHAKATELIIQLIHEEHKLYISVEDNGIGFSSTSKKTFGLGLRNVKALVHKLEGQITIDSNNKSGTSINIDIPTQ